MNVSGKLKNRRVGIEIMKGNVDGKVEKIIALESRRLNSDRKIITHQMFLTFESFLLMKDAIQLFLEDEENQKIILEQLNLEKHHENQ